MPRGDRTGPTGLGPMTGRAAGYCAGYPLPGYMNPYGGQLGLGFGWGRGRWWGYPYSAPTWGAGYGAFPYATPYSRDQEKEALQNQVKFFEDQLDAMRKRIEEIEAEASKESK